MKTIHPLHFFCTVLLMAGLAISCNKTKNSGPIKEKLPIEYIPQMAGKRKMVGTNRQAYPLATPPTDTTKYIETYYDISILSDSVIFIETSDGSEYTCKYGSYNPDMAFPNIDFSVASSSYTNQSLYYYFLKDSLVYHSFYNHNFLWETKLHSE